MTLSVAHYHQKTSYSRLDLAGQALDWDNQPNVYKAYPGREPIPLPREPRLPEKPLADLFRPEGLIKPRSRITAEELSAIFLLTYSLTARARHSGGDFYYRSAASAGALYPTEIYTALAGVNGLEDGLYHFSIARHGLTQLRSGAGFSLGGPERPEPATAARPYLVFFLTAIFFRSSWKYRNRAFRYHLLDTGHVLEHLVLALKALSLPYQLTFDFEDQAMGRLLGLDEKQEAPLALCLANAPEGHPDFLVTPEWEPLAPVMQHAGRVAEREVDYPLIREAYRSGATVKRDTASGPGLIKRLGPEPVSWLRLSDPVEERDKSSLKQTVFSRRSRRNYLAEPLSLESWQALWDGLVMEEQEQTRGVGSRQVLALGCLADRVEDTPPGFYLLDWGSKSLGLAIPGSLTRPMAGICLDQSWLARAAVHFCFLTNIRLLEEQRGPRGYRYAMMQAGRLGERLYLTATSLGLGCCGIGAFYDQEAADLLGLNQDSRLLYLVAVGPVKSVR